MRHKLSEETIDKMRVLYKENLPIKDISRIVKVPYTTVCVYTKVFSGEFNTLHQYQEHLIKERGFESYHEYTKYLIEKRGFESYHEYTKYLIEKRGFKSHTEYQQHLAKNKGFKSHYQYLQHLAKERGFKSLHDYEIYRYTKRQKLSLNKKVSRLIKEQLEILERNAKWLAEQLDITEGAVSRYISRKTTPKKNLQPRFFKVLKLPYKTLDDLL